MLQSNDFQDAISATIATVLLLAGIGVAKHIFLAIAW
jgi:hypothetical protein